MTAIDTSLDTPELLQERRTKYNTDPKIQKFIATMVSTYGYKNTEKSVLRENANNAYDGLLKRAYAEGVNVSTLPPVEVTLPRQENDFTLTIQDYGSGMTMAETCHYHGDVWNSDKRGDDRFAGEMGIGAKSGFALSDTITVETVKDGTKSTVIYTAKPDGDRTQTPVFHGPTDEQNGTKISIPTSGKLPLWDWQRYAKETFQWWDENSVIVDGNMVEPKKIAWLSDSIGIYTDNATHDSTILMGHTAYPLPEDELKRLIDIKEFTGTSNYNHSVGQSIRFVFAIPNKAMTALISREALTFNDAARDLLQEYADEAKKLIIAYNQKILDEIAEYNDNQRANGESEISIGKFDRKLFGAPQPERYTYRGESLDTPVSSQYLEFTPSGKTYTSNVVEHHNIAAMRFQPLTTSFSPYDTLIITHCDDTNLKTLRTALSYHFKKFDESGFHKSRISELDHEEWNDEDQLCHFLRYRYKFYAILKPEGPTGYERVIPMAHTLDARPIVEAYRTHQRELRRASNARKKAAEAKAKAHQEEYDAITKRILETGEYDVCTKLGGEARRMTIDEIKAAKPKLLYVTDSLNRTPDFNMWAEEKKRLIIESPRIEQTMQQLEQLRLKPVHLRGNFYDRRPIEHQEWKYASRFIKNLINTTGVPAREHTLVVERLVYLSMNTDIPFANKRVQRLVDEIKNLHALSFVEWDTPLRRGDYDASPIYQWTFKHPLLVRHVDFNIEGYADDLMRSINSKRVKL